MQASDYSIPSGLSFSGAWLPMPASVLLLAFDHAPVPQLLPKIRAAIEGIFADGTENSHPAGPVYLADSLHWVIVVSHKLPLSKAQVQAELVRQGGRLIAYLRSNHHLECTIGVSNPCYDSSQLQTYVEQCQVALHGRMYDGPGRVSASTRAIIWMISKRRSFPGTPLTAPCSRRSSPCFSTCSGSTGPVWRIFATSCFSLWFSFIPTVSGTTYPFPPSSG